MWGPGASKKVGLQLDRIEAVYRALILGILVLGVSACRVEPQREQDYVVRVLAARAEKDVAFQSQKEPVPEARKAELLPLLYYDVDPSYNVPAAFKASKNAETFDMVYSDGAIRKVRRLGTLDFTLKGQPLKLMAYMEVGSPNDRLFVPFKDQTNESETYPAGRYIDLDRTPTGLYELDFNVAYNPSCYFSPLFSCPVTPRENHLALAIPAGEKIKTK
jgi:uncharacterized protein (DUF1684 family)